jgi:acyl-coenzyme A synthetase/AMP-(fatty) acid ligase
LLRERVTVLNQTPTAFRQLLQADLTKPRADFALRFVIFGGEALDLRSLRPWLERYGDNQPLLVNMYGITETAVHVTCRVVGSDDLEAGHRSVIGRRISDMLVYILDPCGQPVPVGVIGEMHVGGAGVARGYLNRPDLTAERFIEDPFCATTGARMYRTGDMARRLEDGDIEYLGRIDDQVKIRGFRIELSEIESELEQHPDVRQAAVRLWTVRPDDVRIVACCIPARGGVLNSILLRKHLRGRLPDYMIPQYFLPVSAIPITPNGKADRHALPTPAIAESRPIRYDATSGAAEVALAEIWTGLIGPAQPIGRLDKFFEVGGDSLLGVQALQQVEDRLGARLEFRALFDENLAELAARCVAGGSIGPLQKQVTS